MNWTTPPVELRTERSYRLERSSSAYNGQASHQPTSTRKKPEPPHLHQPTSHVSRLGGLDSGVDQSLSTRDGVEQELGREETRVETVTDESLRRWILGAFGEVRERTVLEAVRDTVSRDNLLPNTSNHLRHVDLGSCRKPVVSIAEGKKHGRERGAAHPSNRKSP
jgi:hypothetical protein